MEKTNKILASSLLITGVSLFVLFTPLVRAITNHTLTINFGSPNAGSISLSTGGSCGSDCTKSIADGTSVTLTASPDSGGRFVYWGSGGANDINCNQGYQSAVCTFTMNQNLEARPLWDYSSVNINVSKTGSGSGTISGTGINCGSDCSASHSTNKYPQSSGSTNLTATPASGSKFVGWETSGNICFSYSGKTTKVRNTSSTCTYNINSFVKNSTAVALFEKTTSSSSSSNSPDADSSSTEKPSTMSIEPAKPNQNKPATESLSNMSINGDKFDPKKSEKMVFEANQPINFSGKTISGGVVTLFVFSEPQEYSTTADGDGTWSIEVANLPEGDHHAEIEVTDPKTKETSKRTKLLEFSVANIATATDPHSTTNLAGQVKKSSTLVMILGTILGGLIVVLATTAGLIYKFKPELIVKLKAKFHKTPPDTV